MKNTLKFFGIAFATASLFGCGSGSSSSSNNATGCITTESVDGGINFTNICFVPEDDGDSFFCRIS